MSSGVEQVFPRPGGTSPAAGTGGSTRTVSGVRLGQRELMIGGAVAVVGLALFSRSRAGGDVSQGDDEATSDAGSAAGFEIDTRATDFYNDLQPELEAINDTLQGIAKMPPASPKPTPPKAGPKATPYIDHMVRRGESLASIAKKYRTTRAKVYAINKQRIELTARSHGRKSSGNGRFIYPGTVLRVPRPKGR